MKTSELISHLQSLVEKHGDLHVLVTGFDSTGYDDLAEITIASVSKVANPSRHSPAYIGGNNSDYALIGGVFNAVYIG